MTAAGGVPKWPESEAEGVHGNCKAELDTASSTEGETQRRAQRSADWEDSKADPKGGVHKIQILIRDLLTFFL